MERVGDVLERSGQGAWLVNAQDLEPQSLVAFGEGYLRGDAGPGACARHSHPGGPGLWEPNQADPALPDWERYEVPLVRASKVRVLGLAP